MPDGAVTGEQWRRWKKAPAAFIEEALCDPETGAPFTLLPAERTFLTHCFQTNGDGRLLYPEQVYSCPKKSGKTAFAAMHTLATTILYGGRFAEAYCLANDLDQAQGRVFTAIKRIVEASPALRCEAKITVNKIEFPNLSGAAISAIASDYTGSAGANPSISVFDELWGYAFERARRLWDEMVPPPTRKISCRLTVSYAGFEGESQLLEELYKRGLSQQLIGADLYAGAGLLMFWAHVPIAPWQTPEWLEQMRGALRTNAYLRMIENRFVSNESQFVESEWYEQCVDPKATPVVSDTGMPVMVGIDASVKRDSTGIVAVTWDRVSKRVRVVFHRIFQPTQASPLDFEATIERTVRELMGRFSVRGIYYDPYQMASTAQRLQSLGAPMREFAQTPANLTAMGSNLYELIKGSGIVFYPDAVIKAAIGHAVAKETPRGWQITKAKTSHKIDVVVALAMAALNAVEQGPRQPSLHALPIIITTKRQCYGDHPGAGAGHVSDYGGSIYAGGASERNPALGLPQDGRDSWERW